MLMAAVDDEIVTLRLARDRFRDRRIEQAVALRCAQRRAQVGGIFLTEPHVKRAGAGYADAIARFAKIVGEGSNETEAAASLGNAHEAGPPAGLVVDVFQRVTLSQPRSNDGQRQVLVKPPLADVAKRHHLDEREVHAASMRPLHEFADLVLVDT